MKAYKVVLVELDYDKAPASEINSTRVTNYFSDYADCVKYAKEHGCTRFYGDIDDGHVTVTSKIRDEIDGKIQTQVTIHTIRIN